MVFDNRHASTLRLYQSDDRHPIDKAMRQPNIGDVGAPHLMGADDVDAPQQIRVNLVLRMRLAGIGAGRHARQTEGLHLCPVGIKR